MDGGVNKYNDSENNITITEVLNDGNDTNNLGLSSTTISTMKKYDKIFENFENGNYTYSDISEKIIKEMGNEIEELYFSVIKEKMSSVTGIDKDDFKLRPRDPSIDSPTCINAYEDDTFNKKTWNERNIFDIFDNTNIIPDKLANAIEKIEEIKKLNSNLEEDIANGTISSYEKYFKKLQKYYNYIEKIATCEIVIDENENITLIQYEKEQSQDNQRNNDNER